MRVNFKTYEGLSLMNDQCVVQYFVMGADVDVRMGPGGLTVTPDSTTFYPSLRCVHVEIFSSKSPYFLSF